MNTLQIALDVLYPIILFLLGISLLYVATIVKQVFGTKTLLHKLGYYTCRIGGIGFLVIIPIAIAATIVFGRHFIPV